MTDRYPHMTTENAKIASTSLGMEGHGIFSFFVHLEGCGWGCGFGGLRSDGPGVAEAIRRILHVVGVESWEQLPGRFVRSRHEGPGCTVEAIGHLIEDRWVSASELGALIRGEA